MSTTCTYFTKQVDSIKVNNKISKLDERDAILSYYPESFDFGNMYEGEVNGTTFEVWNSGCCILYYSFNWNCSWVDVFPKNGASITEHDTINININTTGLLTGSNLCNISILSDGGNGYFIVNVNIIRGEIVNITVYEAWEILNNTENGIQYPIDFRTNQEWKIEHINTPIPENPRHHPIDELQDEIKLQEFLSEYRFKTIVVYSDSGTNSFIAAQFLINNNFQGLVFNMFDGINTWKEAGYPVKGNDPPEKPIITGPTKIIVGLEYNFTFIAADPDQDYIFYSIHWGDTKVDLVGPIASNNSVTVGHKWNYPDNYVIGTKVIDRYDDESEWGFLEVKISKNKTLFKNNCLFNLLFNL